jgi:iron complex transport system substrate-binding protein
VLRLDLYNGVALAASIVASMLAAGDLRTPSQVRVEQVAPRAQPIAQVTLPDGELGVRDASGVVAPLGRYVRIASASLIADHVLWELCEPERLIAVSQRTKESAHFGYRHRERAAIGSPAELESILALDPDLLFINHFGDPRYAARLRDHGIVVFDLGEMRGLQTLLPNMQVIGALLGESGRADALARRFERRLRAVAEDVPAHGRPRAIYLSTYGKQLYGGGAQTSYDDVLRHAGLDNVAASLHRGWPALSPEQVLSMDPDVLVTKSAMGVELCRFPGLGGLRPCRGEGRIVELDAELIDDPGLPILEVTETLHAIVHGGRAQRAR